MTGTDVIATATVRYFRELAEKRQELEAMPLVERVKLEHQVDEAHDLIRTVNDEDMARLYESGLTQAEVSELAGSGQPRVSEALKRQGTKIRTDKGGRPKKEVIDPDNSLPQNGDGPAEEVDGEVVDDPNDRPAHHLPDVVADDADQNLRTTAVRWFEWGRHVEELLEEGTVVEPKDRADKAAIKREATHMAAVARRLKGAF